MKIHLKIFLPALPEAIGQNELEIDFPGTTVQDLIEHLISIYGQKARSALQNEQGEFDPLVQILLNGENWILHDNLQTPLQEGDSLVLMMMMAGG